MKRVTMVVHIGAYVPDDAELDDLCLIMDTSLVEVSTIHTEGPLEGSEVVSFHTIEVFD